MEAAFADVALPRSGVRFELVMGEDHGLRLADSSEGEASIDVTRGEWVAWQDDLGAATLPLAQNVTITTPAHVVELRFSCPQQHYARLLFPHQDALFSDFEALGATVEAIVTDAKTGAVVEQFTSKHAGIEFGYKAPINQQQQ